MPLAMNSRYFFRRAAIRAAKAAINAINSAYRDHCDAMLFETHELASLHEALDRYVHTVPE